MALGKFLEVGTTGLPTEVEANETSAGAGDASKLVRLDSTGRFSPTFMPVGIGADTESIVTSEDLSAGDFVNVYDNAAVPNARKADATAAAAGKRADGFVLAGTTSGQSAIVYFEGKNTQMSGLTIGALYFLSDSVPGGVVVTPPATTGHISQVIGKAVSATAINVEISDPIIRA